MPAERVDPASGKPVSEAAGGARQSTAARPSDEQLLEAACRAFAEFGLLGTSMDVLAKRANTTKPTLYAHFGSKDELYEACLRREAAKLTQQLFTTYEQAAALPAGQQIHAGMRAFFDYAAERPDGFRLLFDDQTRGNVGAVRSDLLNAITERVSGRVRAVAVRHGGATPTVSADLLAAMVVGIAVHGIRHALRCGSIDLAQPGELASSLASAGMRHLDPELMKTLDEADS
ncbi:TetR/AcrR family transcriptional regulator [Amycolatopsis ultiminotia]|uniref:TetR/AcrR family transcriptional regulator n=1 Tax=Amycolatopsis ultiminotia TaxID=543629 RepID=A0ABP6Y3F3_9PSEU